MKKFLLLLVLSTQVWAAVPSTDFEFLFNRLGPSWVKYQGGTIMRESHRRAICVYDFAKEGGAVGAINLRDTGLVNNCTLPVKAIITNGLVDVTTSLTGGAGATVSIDLATTADLVTSRPIASYSGQMAVTPTGASTAIKLSSAAKTVTATVGTAALTAGHFRVFVDYSLSE